ncbi:hypothetical protein Dimus_028549 [Dionaea muscipula]
MIFAPPGTKKVRHFKQSQDIYSSLSQRCIEAILHPPIWASLGTMTECIWTNRCNVDLMQTTAEVKTAHELSKLIQMVVNLHRLFGPVIIELQCYYRH